MTSRTPLRNNDVQRTQDAQRPLNENIRDLAMRFDALPRRSQTWLRFSLSTNDGVSSIIGERIVCPYATAAVVVLAVVVADSSATPLSAAPWLSVEPVDGSPNTMRVLTSYGIPTSGVVDLLVEFVENVTARWPRNDVTGGEP